MENINYIVKQSIAGNAKQQRALYEMHRTRWFMLCLRYGKNKAQAEDIFQEGLIQVFKDLKQYDASKAGFSTWSSRVLINAALKYLKKFNWINNFEDLSIADQIEDNSHDVFDVLSASELTFYIQNLPLGYKIVFNMYAIEGYSHKEIADTLGITVGTSKSQLSKARKELRKKLESHFKLSPHG